MLYVLLLCSLSFIFYLLSFIFYLFYSLLATLNSLLVTRYSSLIPIFFHYFLNQFFPCWFIRFSNSDYFFAAALLQPVTQQHLIVCNSPTGNRRHPGLPNSGKHSLQFLGYEPNLRATGIFFPGFLNSKLTPRNRSIFRTTHWSGDFDISFQSFILKENRKYHPPKHYRSNSASPATF